MEMKISSYTVDPTDEATSKTKTNPRAVSMAREMARSARCGQSVRSLIGLFGNARHACTSLFPPPCDINHTVHRHIADALSAKERN